MVMLVYLWSMVGILDQDEACENGNELAFCLFVCILQVPVGKKANQSWFRP